MVLARICVFLIHGYRIFLRPLIAFFTGTPVDGACRFYPSCSQYALDAFTQRGFFKGGFLTAKRLLRCHPWAKAAPEEGSPHQPTQGGVFPGEGACSWPPEAPLK